MEVNRKDMIQEEMSIQYRPAFHFSPAANFLNDPNGLLFSQRTNTYHLYYQYNPTDVIAGNTHWGHATSPDLYHWVDEAIALYPTSDGALAFSGSMVNDVNNTSGLFPSNVSEKFVAVYTQAQQDKQVQAIAYSLDGGLSFSQYEKNPVLDLDEVNFRDPQVQWFEPESKWLMTVVLSREHKVEFYESQDLKSWKKLSELTIGIRGVDYECPNLVPLRNKDTGGVNWVLFISVNPGMPLGGSGTQYIIGDFDGKTFTPLNGTAVTNFVDMAKDNYALQYFNRDHLKLADEDIDNATYVGWFGNWQYCQTVPTGSWRGAMTSPRKISVKRNWMNDVALVQEPRDLDVIRTNLSSHHNISLRGQNVSEPLRKTKAVPLQNVTAATEVVVEGSFSSASKAPQPGSYRLQVDIQNDSGETLQLGVDVLTGQLWIDRSQLRNFDDPFFTGKFSAASISPTQHIKWQILLDGSLLELYADDGFIVASVEFFAKNPLTEIQLSLKGEGSFSGTLTQTALKKTVQRATLP